MSTIAFTLPGRLAGKGRPRATSAGGFTRLYTPAKTRAEEARVALFARQAMGPDKPLEGPLSLEITIVQTPPASWSKKKAQVANWITQRPDLSNQIKSVEDGMNGIVYSDDCQLARITAERVWRTTGDERVEIIVSSLK